jgi:hypothetical protein
MQIRKQFSSSQIFLKCSRIIKLNWVEGARDDEHFQNGIKINYALFKPGYLTNI